MAGAFVVALRQAQTLLRGMGWLILPAWPALVWTSFTHPQIRWLLPLLSLLFVLRILTLWGQKSAMGQAARVLALVGLVLCAASLALRNHHLLLWYPVAANVVMLSLFGGSLLTAMPLVERLARWREPDLPAKAVAYARRVTQIWCGFFIINGGIALVTCLAGSLRWWALWNGVLSYLLMGALMAGEMGFRRRLRAGL
ncbi:hypothetical protein ABK905_07470 [Acerihabitans sp. KWT182]|uniref:DNA gyrase subunit B n=1 Tax=Acerihabitans sp. KWT182 TaxID=3157919 RepID=A0AAU7QCJ1_9GAMM